MAIDSTNLFKNVTGFFIKKEADLSVVMADGTTVPILDFIQKFIPETPKTIITDPIEKMKALALKVGAKWNNEKCLIKFYKEIS